MGAFAARLGIIEMQLADRLRPENAPSIRTIIAATEHLMQDGGMMSVTERIKALARRSDDDTDFPWDRYLAILAVFDRTVLDAYEFLVE